MVFVEIISSRGGDSSIDIIPNTSMIPLNLSLSGFLSYRDEVELDFNSFELACISGANGAGKSSLLDAITFALFGQARKRDESIINTQSETAEVTFVFAYEGNNYRVQRAKARGKNAVLEFHIRNSAGKWKALTERTMRDTDARIQETLRLDYETFVNASFFLQGKADQFTQQRPADRKRILSNILGLEIWENYRLRAADERKKRENEISSLDGRLQEINAELSEEGARKARLQELNKELERLSTTRKAQEVVLDGMQRRAASVEQQAELVSTLTSQLERAQSQVDESRKRLEARQIEQALHRELIEREETIRAAYQNWQDLREELTQWDEIAGRFNEQERQRNAPLTTIETEKARLQSDLENLQRESQKTRERLATASDLEKELQKAQKEISTIEARLKEKAEVEAQLEEAHKAQAAARAENPHLKEQMEELKARIEQIKKAKGASCPTCGQPLTKEHRQEMVTQWTVEGTQLGDRYRANQNAVKESDQRVSQLEKSLSGLLQVDGKLREQTRSADQLSASLDDLKQLEILWTKEQAPRLAEIEERLKKENYAQEARTELAAIDAELKAIGYDAAKHDALRKAELEARSIEGEMRKLEQALAASKPLEREIEDLVQQIKAREEEFSTTEKAHTQAAAVLAAAEADLPDVLAAEKQVLALKEQENLLRQEVGAAKQRVDVLDDLRERKRELAEARHAAASSVGQFQALERAFGKDGVPAMLIEQALPQIEAKANEILERLSGGNMHIRFVTQQAYKDSKREDLRETLDIQISDSAGVRDYEMFSGGEAFRINFAIRLALSEVLAQRAGARLQTLVIDEGFGSQDEAGRQRLVEAINLVKEDFAKILVITHIDALKDAFPTRIEVLKTSRGSAVQVV